MDGRPVMFLPKVKAAICGRQAATTRALHELPKSTLRMLNSSCQLSKIM
jgi:hypothetical protein